jgi:hypothetical protein
MINPLELSLSPKVSRPLSPKMSLSILELLSGQAYSKPLDPAEVRRLRIRLEELKKHKDPASLLRSWVRFEHEPIELFARKSDLEKLRRSPLVVASGASNPLSGNKR